MIDMNPMFVSSEDFLNYWGIDLRKEMKDNENSSFKADMFLKRVEDRLMTWIDSNTFRIIPWEYYTDGYVYDTDREAKIAEVRKDRWKKAILTQAMYIFKNSEIGLDSGYDPEKGIIAKKAELDSIEICGETIDLIKSAGLYNHVMKNRHRYTSFY